MLVKIVPIAEAAGAGGVNLSPAQPGFGVTIAPLRQLLEQTAGIVPAGAITHPPLPQFRHQPGHFLQQIRLHGGKAVTSEAVDLNRHPVEIVFPGLELGICGAIVQQNIALAQEAPIDAPQGKRGLFHVEHAPVEKTAALFGGAGYQRLTAGFKTHDRAGFKQGSKRRQFQTVLPSHPSVPLPCQTDFAGAMVAAHHGMDCIFCLSMPTQCRPPSASKGTSA